MADPIPLDGDEPEPDPPSDLEQAEADRPPAPGKAAAPLPRLWKAESQVDVNEESLRDKKKKAKSTPETPSVKAGRTSEPLRSTTRDKNPTPAAKKSKGPRSSKSQDPDGLAKKGVLIEETPTYDTYEARQRVRIAIGTVLLVLALIGGYLIYGAVLRQQSADAPGPQDIATQPPPPSPNAPRDRDEQEARILFDRARDFAKTGKVDQAVALLKRVVTRYPTTQSGLDSKDALDRPPENLPLFLDRPAVVARPGTRPASPSQDPLNPSMVVDASKTLVVNMSGAQANLTLPANPAEAASARPASPAPPLSAALSTARALPKGFRPAPGTSATPGGWPAEIVGDRDGALMVLVPGATFIQGRDDSDPSEGPAHQVILSTFYIDQHEVTVREFNLFQKEAGKRVDRARALAKDPNALTAEADEERPVVMVSARDASDYGYWAGKRLPTEAQWEAAARTPDGRPFPWGSSPPAWPRPRAPRQIDSVQSFPTDMSPYRVYDLAGNAWEWTKDWHDPKYYQLFRTTPADNPTGPAIRPRSQQLVVKGSAKDWSVAKREGIKFETRLPYLGFRCALQVEGPGNAFEPPPGARSPAAAPGADAPAQAAGAVPF